MKTGHEQKLPLKLLKSHAKVMFSVKKKKKDLRHHHIQASLTQDAAVIVMFSELAIDY